MTTAEFEKWVKTQLEIGKLTLEAMKTLEKLAKDSVEAGDKADLAAAIGGTHRPSKLPAQKEIDDNFNQFGNGDPTLKKIVEALRLINQQVAAIKARIQAMKIQPQKAYVKTVNFAVKALAGVDPLIQRVGPQMVMARIRQNVDQSSKLTSKQPTNKNAQSFSVEGTLTLSSVTGNSLRGKLAVSYDNGSANVEVKIPTKDADEDMDKLIIKIVDDAMGKVIPALEKLVT
jgi:hypothetical protein